MVSATLSAFLRLSPVNEDDCYETRPDEQGNGWLLDDQRAVRYSSPSALPFASKGWSCGGLAESCGFSGKYVGADLLLHPAFRPSSKADNTAYRNVMFKTPMRGLTCLAPDDYSFGFSRNRFFITSSTFPRENASGKYSPFAHNGSKSS